jgi:hypothetical protein
MEQVIGRKAEAANIRQKTTYLREILKKRTSIYPVMLTTFGCEKNMHYLGLVFNEVVLDDLFVPYPLPA